MWDIMGYPKMSNFTGKIWENMGKWWWTCGWNGVSYIFQMRLFSLGASQLAVLWNWDSSSGHPETNPWSKASPARHSKSYLEIIQLDFTSRKQDDWGFKTQKTAGPPHHDPHEIHQKSMLSCNYETEPAWISLGRLKKGLSEHLAWSSLAPGRKIYIGWPGTSKRPTPLRACEWGNWLWVKVSTSGTLEIHKVQSILHYVYLWHRKCMFCSFLF